MVVETLTKKIYDLLVAGVPVSATNLDIRDLSHTQDSVKVGDGTDFLAIDGAGKIGVSSMPSVAVTGTFWQATQPVSATDLDIRDLTSASDSVEAKQSTAANLKAEVHAAAGQVIPAGIHGWDGSFWETLNTDTNNRLLVAATGAFYPATQPVSGTFWQATQPVSGTFWQATQPVSGTVTANAGTGTLTVNCNSSNVTVDNSTGASAVNIRDGGNSITIDDGGSSLTVDSADLTAIKNAVQIMDDWDSVNTCKVSDAGGSLTVDASNLDIRDLTSASDSVKVYQNKAGTMGYGAVSVGNTATAILISRSTRTGFIIVNNSAQTVYLGGDAVSTANGVPVEAGGSYGNQDWTGAFYGIVASGTADVRFEDFY